MNNRKLARVRYDEKKDEFILELWDDEFRSWGFSRSARCVEGKNTGAGADFIHFSFMKAIVECCEFGYTVRFAGEGRA